MYIIENLCFITIKSSLLYHSKMIDNLIEQPHNIGKATAYSMLVDAFPYFM